MAVETMKLLTIAGPLDRFDEIAANCIADQNIHLESALRLMKNTRGLRPLTVGGTYAAPLRKAEDLAAQLSIPLAKSEDTTPWTLETIAQYFEELDQHIVSVREQREDLTHKIEQARGVVGHLDRLDGLSNTLAGLWDMSYARFRYGYLPTDTYHAFASELDRREDLIFLPSSTEGGRTYGVYFTTKSSHLKVDSLMNSLHFVRVWIDATPTGSAHEAVSELNTRAAEAEKKLAALDEDAKTLGQKEQEKFLSAYTWLRYHKECQDIRRFAGSCRDTFYLTGWVPADSAEPLMALLRKEPDVSLVLDDITGSESVTPPTKLKSSFMSRIFRPFLELYGVPAYNETDPSLFMALSYCLFFGIMFGDLGQGLGIALIGYLLWKKKQMWLGRIIVCCGLSGAVFGLVYGSVFGFEDILPGFKALEGNHVMVILLAAVALGVFMILLSMSINIINGVKQHNYEKILFGPNGVAGAVFYVGLILLGVSAATGFANLATPAYILPVLVLPLVLILLKEPLAKLLAKDPSWREVHFGELVGLGCFELFETMLSYLTNTLSFLRVGAYAIIHVGLMMVVHMMAGSGNIVVLVLGNLFVMGFEGFLVGIQVLRLEFYELFSRFYDDGGVPYEPHIIDYTVRST